VSDEEAPERYVYLLYKHGGDYTSGGSLENVYATEQAAKDSAEYWAKGERMSLADRLGLVIKDRLTGHWRDSELWDNSGPLKWKPTYEHRFGPSLVSQWASAGFTTFVIKKHQVETG
jgi:hypothetical protein